MLKGNNNVTIAIAAKKVINMGNWRRHDEEGRVLKRQVCCLLFETSYCNFWRLTIEHEKIFIFATRIQ